MCDPLRRVGRLIYPSQVTCTIAKIAQIGILLVKGVDEMVNREYMGDFK
jgi:hypothetical protein